MTKKWTDQPQVRFKNFHYNRKKSIADETVKNLAEKLIKLKISRGKYFLDEYIICQKFL